MVYTCEQHIIMSVQDTYDSAQTWLPLVRESHMLICNDGMLWSLHIVDKTYQLDSMSWFSHRRRTGRKSRPRGRLPNKMPHFQFLSPVTVTLTFDLDTRTRARFLYNALNRQVSSSYVLSFGSDRVDKQTNRQTVAAKNTHLVPVSTMLYAGPAGGQ